MLTMKTVLGPLTLRTTHNTDHTFWMTYIWSCATFSRISEYTGTRLCLKRFSDYEMNLIVYRHGSWSVWSLLVETFTVSRQPPWEKRKWFFFYIWSQRQQSGFQITLLIFRLQPLKFIVAVSKEVIVVFCSWRQHCNQISSTSFFNIFNIIISVGRGSNTDFQLSQTIIQCIPCATW